MLDSVGTGVTNIITWLGSVLTSITGSSGALSALLPMIGVAIGFFVIRFAISIIKQIVVGY